MVCLSYCVLFCLSVGKIPFIHVGNQVVSELGPIVQFTKAKVCNTDMEVVIDFYHHLLNTQRHIGHFIT